MRSRTPANGVRAPGQRRERRAAGEHGGERLPAARAPRRASWRVRRREVERTASTLQTVGRSYTIRTYGCQMNVHDSERMAGLLEAAGYARAARTPRAPTSSCSTPARSARTPTTSSTATSGTCAPAKAAHPGMQIAVGGCLAQKDRERSSAGRRGWTSCSAPTTSARCPVAAGAGPAQRGGPGGDPRVAGGVPLHAARAPGVGLRRLGVDLRRLQQHLHVLHRARRCAAPSGTAGPVTCSPRSRRWPPRVCWR